MSFDTSEKTSIGLAIVFLVVIAAMVAADLLTDYRAGTTAQHLLVELLVFVLATAGVFVLWREYRVAREAVAGLQVDVEAATREAERWRQETEMAATELRDAINRQFGRWNLSDAERDVASSLLRGLSHKEIAQHRRTSERTVREQARSVYQKSGIGGRSELAAFFLQEVTTMNDET